MALAYLGGMFVLTDRVEEGLVFCDEALAALCAGELTEVGSVDKILCGLLWACELVTDVATRGAVGARDRGSSGPAATSSRRSAAPTTAGS